MAVFRQIDVPDLCVFCEKDVNVKVAGCASDCPSHATNHFVKWRETLNASSKVATCAQKYNKTQFSSVFAERRAARKPRRKAHKHTQKEKTDERLTRRHRQNACVARAISYRQAKDRESCRKTPSTRDPHYGKQLSRARAATTNTQKRTEHLRQHSPLC